MANYSIKDLEKLSGIKAHTIRIWEKRYKLVKPKRTDTNIRFYDDNDLKRILNIALLNRKGLKISYLAQLEDSDICTKVKDISNGDQDNEYAIENLVMAMVELDERRFEKILSHSIMRDGFETTLINVIHPFFEKIGILWLTGAINPAQEHFMSNLLRQKLIVAIDGIVEPNIVNFKNFTLYLPEGELHELGLLFYYYLLKKRGHNVTYLGQSVPFEDLHTVINIRHSDYLLTAFMSSINGVDVNEYLHKLALSFPAQGILFVSNEHENLAKDFPSNVRRINNATDLQIFMNEIE